ncbi:hypothetical protein ACFQZE_06700 [Paenibacillus sp. GCM10027627]|uniref:hypothetical protein n=1 Tax=unclassified Paenibacillus TaxID=185978 RepID=UPI00362A4CAE
MSETVYYRGILKECKKIDHETLEGQCRRLLEYKGLPSYYDSYQELLLDEYYHKYIIRNGLIYTVERQELDVDQDIFSACINEDGESIDFEVKYYNGGCSFNEAIELALDNLKGHKT